VSDHQVLGFLVAVVGLANVVAFLVTTSMLRECQRLTRAVAALVYQEGEKTRAALLTPPPA
jgi:hypothetical protein